MVFPARACCLYAPLLAALVVLSGCERFAQGQLDEEKEPHFLAGKSKVSNMDYPGAIESFEKALQANPQSASAHFELGCLYEKESDPAAAIYHYEHYLKLHPTRDNEDVVKQRITACKQMLAQTITLGPVTERVQREFEQLSEDKKQLTKQNQELREELEKWRTCATALQAITNRYASQLASARSTATGPATGGTQITGSISGSNNSTGNRSSPNSRTHTVKPGETPTLIARQYGIRVEALMAANPRLNPRRMLVGQSLRIPVP
jgi:LysM repeat protein